MVLFPVLTSLYIHVKTVILIENILKMVDMTITISNFLNKLILKINSS